MNFISKIFSKFLSSNSDDKESVRENIVNVLDNKSDAENISKQERLMLRNILKINEITARDIMIPRANIFAVETNDTLDSVLDIFLKEAHSRAPVYEKNLDNIIKPYYTTKAKGSGLGLSIVNKIINDHNSTIKFIQEKIGAKVIINFKKNVH